MRKVDLPILVITIVLVFFGILMVYDASSVIAFRDFGDKYHFIKDQIIWATLGLVCLFIFSIIDYHLLGKLAVPLFVLTIIFLVGVFIPGFGVKLLGASRWLDFKLFLFQPTEFSKLVLTIYLAAWFSNKEKGRFWAFLLLLVIVLGLIIAQPDMGTGIILAATSLIIYFLSGANLMHFLLLAPVGIVVTAIFIKIAPYRMARMLTFLDPLRDPQGASYHIQQILIAVGSGGLLGVGLGQSRQKYEYLPEAVTDSIFAIVAEETGFIGTSLIIFLFIFLFTRCFKVAREAKDSFGRLLAGGIATFLAVQTVINMGAQVALLPLTGIPLPFISYGGSSLIISLSAIGIILNISKTATKI